tara:strand:+ start:9052 stop:9555 length:504 start_codon:yes stop_codon:yes gene_type:complete
MKNNATVVALLLIVLFFMLIWPFSLYFSGLPTPSVFDNTHLIEGEIYSSIWINAVLLNNIILSLTIAITSILLIMAFRKWNNIKHYDVSIIKKLDVCAYLFIAEGILTLFLSIRVPRHGFIKTDMFNTLHLDFLHGTFLLVTGLLFALITSILTNAKVVKDENDLTI